MAGGHRVRRRFSETLNHDVINRDGLITDPGGAVKNHLHEEGISYDIGAVRKQARFES